MLRVDRIISAGWLLSADLTKIIRNQSVIIDGNIIKDIIPTNKVKDLYKSSQHEEYLDHMLMPGLINTNSQSILYLHKGKYNKKINNRQINRLSLELQNNSHVRHIKLTSDLAICNMIKNGVTTFCDTTFYPEILIDRVLNSGIRSNIGLPVVNKKTIWAKNNEESFSKSLKFYDEFKSEPNITLSLNLQSINNLDNNLAEKFFAIANEIDVPIRINMYQSKSQLESFIKNKKNRPIKYLKTIGVLSKLFTAINLNYLTDDDVKIINKYGVNISNDISSIILCLKNIDNIIKSNLSLNGGNILTDGSYDLFDMMRKALLLSKISSNKKKNITIKNLLQSITINGVKSLGLDNKIGVIKKGFLADIISLKVDSIYSTEEILYNNLENVLISTRIENVWVSGKKILNNAKLVTINEKILYDAYRKYNE
tara:strand:- start:391 stop:1668 length:1278 start_codon:yes stop_codon:yes gene_type:complete